jgi:hypothetical protein
MLAEQYSCRLPSLPLALNPRHLHPINLDTANLDPERRQPAWRLE